APEIRGISEALGYSHGTGARPVTSEQRATLLEAARKVSRHAHAPYSGYHVGAALLTRSGAVFTGCNVENASYGATLCAERAAIASMIAAGDREVVSVLVFTEKGPPAMPCGICRQTLVEFATPDCSVYVATGTDQLETTLGALLPEPFVFRK
ncbi:MAG TPA: cytidine deaminase, partial [Polyangiaceae bacterium]|nr:cytidine deaminase [Polyangiaceae bacterium]